MASAYLVQMQPIPGDKGRTLEHARDLVSDASPEQGGLIVFPEMFATGFLENPSEALAEDIGNPDSPTRSFLQRLADETKCSVLGGGIEKFPCGKFPFRNWTGIFSPGEDSPISVYRKRHPFAGEALRFSPGKELTGFEWNGLRCFPFLCFDLRFPEDFRRARLWGASLFTVQAEWPRCREGHFSTLLRARAIENQAYVLATSRAGENFAPSRAFAPDGSEMFPPDFREGVFALSVDPNTVSIRRQEFPLPLPNFEDT